jgi:hypothetical protein
MASEFIAKLDAIAAAATPWKTFIRKLGPLHAQWHNKHNAGTGDLGFLLFHWELVQRFKRVGADKGVGGPAGIKPFSTQQLKKYKAAYSVKVPIAQADLASLEEFSFELEAWHNDAHMNIGTAIHKNLMSPRTNVKIPQFWQLHYFINDRFEDKLKNFGGAGSQASTVVASLEAGAGATQV